MNTDMELLQDVKVMASKIRGNYDSGNAYLMGYMWASLTPKQQKEIALSFTEQVIEELEK
jgi:hypothetical protein